MGLNRVFSCISSDSLHKTRGVGWFKGKFGRARAERAQSECPSVLSVP